MNQSITPTMQSVPSHLDEHILVIPRHLLFPHQAWHGINKTDFNRYLSIIQHHKTFMPRALAEEDPKYKQIIPYLIFMYEDTIFLMQRRSDASEARLRNKLSLGIGGHVRQEDMDGATLFDWARREFHEEVDYQGELTLTPLGILNDDSNAVGQVHLGLVLLMIGSSPTISVRSELKEGRLIPLRECVRYKESMESWSSFVLDTLLERETWLMPTP